jgi:hypothetical protein
MAKTLKIDKSSEMVTIELDKNELKGILDSIDLMIQDQKRNQCFNAIKKIANISGAIKIIASTLSVQPKKTSIFILPSFPHSLTPSPDNERRCLAAARTSG